MRLRAIQCGGLPFDMNWPIVFAANAISAIIAYMRDLTWPYIKHLSFFSTLSQISHSKVLIILYSHQTEFQTISIFSCLNNWWPFDVVFLVHVEGTGWKIINKYYAIPWIVHECDPHRLSMISKGFVTSFPSFQNAFVCNLLLMHFSQNNEHVG